MPRRHRLPSLSWSYSSLPQLQALVRVVQSNAAASDPGPQLTMGCTATPTASSSSVMAALLTLSTQPSSRARSTSICGEGGQRRHAEGLRVGGEGGSTAVQGRLAAKEEGMLSGPPGTSAHAGLIFAWVPPP